MFLKNERSEFFIVMLLGCAMCLVGCTTEQTNEDDDSFSDDDTGDDDDAVDDDAADDDAADDDAADDDAADDDAEIEYTDVEPDLVIFEMFDLDLNNDGTADFELSHFGYGNEHMAELTSHNSNEVLGEIPFPSALDEDSPVDGTQGPWNVVSWAYLNQYPDTQGCQWVGVTDKFLGMRIRSGAQWQYGWARLDVPADASSITLKDYAIAVHEDQSILAGEH